MENGWMDEKIPVVVFHLEHIGRWFLLLFYSHAVSLDEETNGTGQNFLQDRVRMGFKEQSLISTRCPTSVPKH